MTSLTHVDLYEPGNANVHGDLQVDGKLIVNGATLGPTGPTGPAGPTGPTGPTGATGAASLAGHSITGALSTVTDAAAKATMTSIVASLVALGATDSTT